MSQDESNPLLERIKGLLSSSEQGVWRVGGPDLTSELRVGRPQSTWEQILVRDIASGSLVLHAVQAVTSTYAPGGYQLVPTGPGRFTVELRDRIFDADKAVDPKFAASQRGKKCDVIASGEIAKCLYLEMRETIRTQTKEKQGGFLEIARALEATLVEKVEQSSFRDWEKIKQEVGDEDNLRYKTRFGEVSVELSRKVKDWDPKYSATFKQDKFTYEEVPSSLAQECFEILEKKDQNSQLEALGDVLAGLGLSEGSKKE